MITDQFTESSSTYEPPSAPGTVPPTAHAANGRWRLRARAGRSETYSTADRAFNGQTLGWLSIGLGLGALLAPRTLGRLTGLGERTALLRLVGCRELASGLALLTQPRQTPWLWSRVAGDAMDLALILSATGPTNPGRVRALVTAGVVGAITAADVAASTRAISVRSHTQQYADTTLSESMVVNKTPQECYDFWRNQTNLTRFTSALQSVTPLDERRSRWVMWGPMHSKVEWTAEITADEPGSHIGWRTVNGSDVEHAGVVRFNTATGGRGTVVRVVMHYRSPGGPASGPLARLMGKYPRFEIREDLRRFKQLLEAGEVATTRGQPSGRRSLLGSRLPSGRLSRQGKPL